MVLERGGPGPQHTTVQLDEPILDGQAPMRGGSVRVGDPAQGVPTWLSIALSEQIDRVEGCHGQLAFQIHLHRV
jgi:hypothetical protein